MSIVITILLTVILANIYLFISLLTSNTKWNERNRKSFSWVVFSVILWLLTILFTEINVSNSIIETWLARLSFATAALINYSFMKFVDSYIKDFKKNIIVQIFTFLTILFIPLSLTHFIVKDIQIVPGLPGPDNRITILGIGQPLFTLLFLTSASYYLLHLYRWQKKTTDKIMKFQITYIIGGTIISVFLTILFNLIFPLLHIFEIPSLGAISLIFFTGSVYYAIINYRFFEIKNLWILILQIFLLATLPFILFHTIVWLQLKAFNSLTSLPALITGYLYSIMFTIIFYLSIKNIRKIIRKIIPTRSVKLIDLSYILLDEIKNLINTEEIIKLGEKYLNPVIPGVKIILLDTKKTTQPDILCLTPLLQQINDELIIISERLLTETNKKRKKCFKELHQKHIDILYKSNSIILVVKIKHSTHYDIEFIKNLNTFFSILAVNLQRALLFEQVKNFANNLEKKVKERTIELEEARQQLQESYAKLEQAYEKLKELDKQKSEFISLASHQLRTPLSIAKGLMSMILDETFGKLNDKQKKYLKKVQTTLNRLTTIVDDMLNTSRLEANRFVINWEEFSIYNLLKRAIDEFDDEAEKKGLEFIANISPEVKDLQIKADQAKIYEVIANLLDNAICYTQEGSVELGAKKEKDKILIWVKDTGIGIPEKDKDKLFEKFSRLENAKKVRPDGSGIGLYLAKIIVEKHNGKIWFESKLGKGTTFYIELPIATDRDN